MRAIHLRCKYNLRLHDRKTSAVENLKNIKVN